ncbi:MFS multidrug transporter [Cordyceps javanica]|nr:MFS multidrug transporter [Cordyceps javanica]
MAVSDGDSIEVIPMPGRDEQDQPAAAAAAAAIGLSSLAAGHGKGEQPPPPPPPPSDPFLVAFDPDYDATNPLDWRAGKKWMVTDVLSATGFNRIMVSTMVAPALPAMGRELGMGPTAAALSMSAYLLATAFGPLVIGPLSEVYGRQVVLHGSGLWFLVWNVLCGFAHSKETLIAARFLAGFGASAIYSLGAGVLGDVWRPEQRGRSLGIYLLIPLLGAAVGTFRKKTEEGTLGGNCGGGERDGGKQDKGAAVQFAAMIFASLFCFPETYGPLILQRRARKLRRDTGDARYHTLSERRDGTRSAVALVARAVSRPTRLLLRHPIIQVVSIKGAIDYGILYIVLSTFSELWMRQYGQSVEISGLHYLVISAAEIAGSQLGGYIMDCVYRRRQHRGAHVPESRLPYMIPFLALGGGGMLMYGWVAQYKLHWAVVDVGVFIMLFGQQLSGIPSTFASST